MQVRQGDVFIERIESLPAELQELPRDRGRIVLAYGEVTGHAHAIVEEEATFLLDPKTEARFLKIFKPVMLRHEEHAPIELLPGLYRVRRQREWTDANEPRVVAD